MRSDCPLNFALELFGDKWTLLIIRDLVFFHKTHYNEFLQSAEGISTNILADRLLLLEKEGFIRKEKIGEHKRKATYKLTEKGIGLAPLLIEIGIWSVNYSDGTLNPKMSEILEEIQRDRVSGLTELRERLYREHVGEKKVPLLRAQEK